MPQHSAEARLLVWNLERRALTSRAGKLQAESIAAVNCDAAVFTETWTGWPNLLGGYETSVFGAVWSPTQPDERKILMWSKSPWSDEQICTFKNDPIGRIVAATTITPIGPLRIIGVCIPYSQANVRHKSMPVPPWHEHRQYISQLSRFLTQQPSDMPTIVAGDFNQRVPKTRAPRDVHDLLLNSLGSLTIHTAGEHSADKIRLIDHMAASHDLEVRGLSLVVPPSVGRRPVTDHTGALLRFSR